MVKEKKFEKEIILEETVRDTFIYGKPEASVGLLIGAYTETADYCVAHLAQTLEEEPNEHESHSQSSSDEDSELPQLKSRSFTVIAHKSLSHHAKQVIRMLPGGLLILGLYIVEDVENIFTAKYEDIIKHLIATLNKSLSKNPYYASNCGSNNERIIFHFNPSTKKFTCKVIADVTFKTRQLETSFNRLEWARLDCDYDTTLAMNLSKPESGDLLKKNLRILMNIFYGKLENAKFFIAGRVPSDDVVFEEPKPAPPEIEIGLSDVEEDEAAGLGDIPDYPDIPFESRFDTDSGNDSDCEGSPKMNCAVHILIDQSTGIPECEKKGEDYVDHLHLQGKISAVAFVRVGSSTSHVVKMIKQDIIRSMASRIEMHCESLIEDDQTSAAEDGEASKVFHEVPHRVFAHLPGSKLLVSDYLFPGEGPRDSVVTFCDILSLNLEDETDILIGKEKPFNLDELRSRVSVEELLAKTEIITKMGPGWKSGGAMIWLIITTILIIIVAVLIPTLLPKIFKEDLPNN